MDREKFRILKHLDIAAARAEFEKKGFPAARHDVTGKPVTKEEVILASLHKARLMQPRLFNRLEKSLSRRWLLTHGYQCPGEK